MRKKFTHALKEPDVQSPRAAEIEGKMRITGQRGGLAGHQEGHRLPGGPVVAASPEEQRRVFLSPDRGQKGTASRLDRDASNRRVGERVHLPALAAVCGSEQPFPGGGPQGTGRTSLCGESVGRRLQARERNPGETAIARAVQRLAIPSQIDRCRIERIHGQVKNVPDRKLPAGMPRSAAIQALKHLPRGRGNRRVEQLRVGRRLCQRLDPSAEEVRLHPPGSCRRQRRREGQEKDDADEGEREATPESHARKLQQIADGGNLTRRATKCAAITTGGTRPGRSAR